MINVIKGPGNITDFTGDALVCLCDVEITTNYPFTKRLFQRGGPELIRECSAIGFCEIGNAVITKGYNLLVQHVIFLPVTDRNSPGETINYLTCHQVLRNALTLAATYSVETIAIPAITFNQKRVKTVFKRLVKVFIGNDDEVGPNESQKEFTDILTSVSSEFNNTSIKEIAVYPAY